MRTLPAAAARMSRRTTRAVHRQRGSVYVEALVVTSLLIFLWMGALAFGRLYALKLTTLLDARTQAWRATTGECGPQRDALSRAVEQLTRSPDAASAQALLDAAKHVSTRGGPSSSVRRARGLLPFFEAERESTLQTSTRFACNETGARSTPDPKQLTAQRWVSQLLHGAKP